MRDKSGYLSIPNILTLLNALCGTLAILILISDNDARYSIAVFLIILGGLFDSFDGKIARMLKIESTLGKELDSLSDIITFGIAPVVLYASSGLINSGIFSYVILACYVVSGVYRLARYNVSGSNKEFSGCPITVSGILLALFYLIITKNWLNVEDYTIYILNTFMILAIFMASRIKVKRIM